MVVGLRSDARRACVCECPLYMSVVSFPEQLVEYHLLGPRFPSLGIFSSKRGFILLCLLPAQPDTQDEAEQDLL